MNNETFYIDVGEDIGTVYDEMVAYHEKDVSAAINFRIDSVGGSLDDAFRIYNYVKTNNLVATVLVTGNCMSAATVILCSVPYIYRSAYVTSQFLIHSAAVPFNGAANATDLSQLSNLIAVKNNQLKSIYSIDTTMGESIDTYMHDEMLFSAQDAVKFGFIKSIIRFENSSAKSTFENSADKSVFENSKIINMNIFKKLKEVINVTTVEGQELPIDKPAVGADCKADDGIYVLEDGTKITIESNKITEVEEPKKKDGKAAEPQDGCGTKESSKEKKVSNESAEQIPDAEPEKDSEKNVKDFQEQLDEISKRLDDIASRLSVLESLNNDITNKVKSIQKVQNSAKFVSDKKEPDKKRSLRDLMNL